ncbi:MAG: PIG-L deacetylase family protein [Pirellula staleyi]
MTRILVLGAHPDDAEFFAGGLLASHYRLGSTIRLISATNGQSGHHAIPSQELIVRRRAEAAAAGRVIGADYVTWDFPDGSLLPSLELRLAIIREIRTFQPDLVLTHRTFDYHPDHRALGQAVQDASYMVLVPKIAPDLPPPHREPIVAYMPDLFTRPCPLRPDVVLDVSEHWESVLEMLDSHESQFYEWMPWIEGVLDSVPANKADRREWLSRWYQEKTAPRLLRFWRSEFGHQPRLIEAYEISEYAGKPSSDTLEKLFPGKRH